MSLIHKADIPAVTIPEEEIFVNEFRGSVIVRALTLHDRLTLAEDKEIDGPTRLVAMLALCVLDAGHHPVYSREEWYAFASRHLDSSMMLWDVARRLSGMGDEGEVDPKKDVSLPSLGLPVLSLSDLDAPSGS